MRQASNGMLIFSPELSSTKLIEDSHNNSTMLVEAGRRDSNSNTWELPKNFL